MNQITKVFVPRRNCDPYRQIEIRLSPGAGKIKANRTFLSTVLPLPSSGRIKINTKSNRDDDEGENVTSCRLNSTTTKHREKWRFRTLLALSCCPSIFFPFGGCNLTTPHRRRRPERTHLRTIEKSVPFSSVRGNPRGTGKWPSSTNNPKDNNHFLGISLQHHHRCVARLKRELPSRLKSSNRATTTTM